MIDFSILKGLTLKEIQGDKGSDKLTFITSNGREFVMFHIQDCCEWVSIEDIVGNLQDLIGSPILLAEVVVSNQPSPEENIRREKAKADDEDYYYRPESETWTFYKLSTIKGSVTIRWYGTSNGYYSESVDFLECYIKGY